MAAVEAQASGLPCVMSTGVPELARVCAAAKRVALDEGAEAWARYAVRAYGQACAAPRTDAIDDVREHGFDIAQTSRWLAEFYQRAESKDGRF